MRRVRSEQMGEATEDYEGHELKEEQFEWDIGAVHEVEDFNGDGEICNGDEKVTDLLADEDAVYAPKTSIIIIIIITVAVVKFRRTRENKSRKQKQ